MDLRQMFRDLRKRTDNPLDNGQVSGNVSKVDAGAFEKIDSAVNGKEEK